MKSYKFKDEYKWLYIITIVLNVTAILILVYAIFSISSMPNRPHSLGSAFSVYLPMIYSGASSFLTASIIFAFAELVKVIARIELNTRRKTINQVDNTY